MVIDISNKSFQPASQTLIKSTGIEFVKHVVLSVLWCCLLL